MAKARKAKTDEPRPVCPECESVVRPDSARPFGLAKSLRERVLEGVYCCSDCLLNAWKRGYPKGRCK